MVMATTVTAEMSEVNMAPNDSNPSNTLSSNSTREAEDVVVSPPPGGTVTSTGEVEKSTSSDWQSGEYRMGGS